MHPIFSGSLIFYACYRAHSHQSLTPAGIAAALVTGVVHAIHPFSTLTICLLFGFYFAGNSATKHKHAIKERLTVSSTGSGSSKTRTHVQVFANSICASVLILAHYAAVYDDIKAGRPVAFSLTAGRWQDALMVGVMTQYAAVLSDTLSSELGILSTSPPRLIYNPARVVPPGTNGGVTLAGFLAGTAGSIFIALISIFATPFAATLDSMFKVHLGVVVVAAGVVGTLLDSLLGATMQASVVDGRAGKIVESPGGEKVLVKSPSWQEGGARRRTHEKKEEAEERGPSRRVLVGRDLLSNNAVNVVMAAAMAAAGVAWGLWHTV
ncbi:hypothetical protein TWF696_009086 [Orbilia brochopaga]|uniref:Transmembrane protein 19 n=1 Tax=Orbilia brochopaga TaxID=3140254 RepID=A0AAV9UI80_9PEZI